MAGLVPVEDRLVRQRVLQLFIGGRHRPTDFLPRMLGAAQADGDLQDAFQEALHHQPGHAAHHGQVGNQGRQVGAELARELVGRRLHQRRVKLVRQKDRPRIADSSSKSRVYTPGVYEGHHIQSA